MNNKIKQHRLAQLGIIKLTARQKNRVAKLCKCSKTHIESVLSDQHDNNNAVTTLSPIADILVSSKDPYTDDIEEIPF